MFKKIDLPSIKMIQNTRIIFGVFACTLMVLANNVANGQCIVINEVMVNGPGPNDGQNAPDTEEWIELYNSCDVPIDISCYVIMDGDFSVTFPVGTTIAAGDFIVLGSGNAGIPVDINWATCSCTSGSSVGVFTNGSEQLLLFDAAGVLQDEVCWGAGQYPISLATNAVVGCAGSSFNQSSSSDDCSILANGGGQGCSIGLTCDGGNTWAEFCAADVSGGASNGSATPAFMASETSICAGDCISFTSIGTSPTDDFNWTFDGAATNNSSLQNPINICYNELGIFTVTMNVVGACGEQEIEMEEYITVNGEVPTVSPLGPFNICEGQNILLETISIGNLQWLLNGNIISGATNPTLDVTVTGEYTLQLIEGSCTTNSEPVVVNVQSNLVPSVLPQSPVIICNDMPVTLVLQETYNTYQWLLDGNEIALATNQELIANTSGIYTVYVTYGDCSGTSDAIEVVFNQAFELTITPDETTSICDGSSVTFQTEENLVSYQWLLNGIPINGANSSSYSASIAGNYSVQATNENDCEAISLESSLILELLTPPIIQSDTDAFAFCAGESIALFLSENYDSYTWFFNGQIILESTQTITVVQTGTYQVSVSLDDCNAISSEIVVVQFATPTIIVLTDSPIETCATTTMLEVSSTDNVNWFFNSSILVNETQETITVSQSGSYYVVAMNEEGCTTLSSTIEVDFVQQITPLITTDALQYCIGEVAQLTVEGNFETIAWNTNEQSNTISTMLSGVYQVSVTNEIGCEGTATVTIQFDPLPYVDAGQDTISDCENGVILSGNGEGTLNWVAASTLSNPELASTLANPTVTTTYTLMATQGNCSASDQVEVEADCVSIFIPNVFTPNNDGFNDVFRVILRGAKEYHLQIFNRWGDIVFESNNPNEPWTGGKNGYFVPDGTYLWIIHALDATNQPLLKQGNSSGTVTILR